MGPSRNNDVSADPCRQRPGPHGFDEFTATSGVFGHAPSVGVSNTVEALRSCPRLLGSAVASPIPGLVAACATPGQDHAKPV
jgi:hypothetical protein